MMRYYLGLLLTWTSLVYGFDATIPVLHLPDYYAEETREAFLEQLEDAACKVGFFALTGTGVATEVLDDAYEQGRQFFAQGWSEKERCISNDGQRGYVPEESAKDEARADFKEFFMVGRELSEEAQKRLGYHRNVWPQWMPNFRPALQKLYSEMDVCQEVLCEAFSHLMEQDSGYLYEMTHEGDCSLRMIHYPKNPPADAIWAAAHTDIVLLTILPRATARGLQVQNDAGEWIDVLVPDDAFIINVGDYLENMTNGYYKSCSHRVIDPGLGEERFSTVFFVHTRSEDRLDPLQHFIDKTGGVRRYAEISRLELLAERLIDLGYASYELMEFFVNSGAIERLREVGRFSPKAERALLAAGFDI